MSSERFSIYNLPELPLELLCARATLEPSTEAPILTIRPERAVIPDKPDPPCLINPVAHCPKASSHYVRRYVTQVTYPKVICQPNNAPDHPFLESAVNPLPEEPSRDIDQEPEIFVQRTRFFKLSAFRGQDLAIPLFCTVHGGPWAATVIETQGCRIGCAPPEVHWRMEIHSFPELQMQWYGTWQDIPAHLHPTMGVFMNDLALVDEGTGCCPGFVRSHPDGPCVDLSLINVEDLTKLQSLLLS